MGKQEFFQEEIYRLNREVRRFSSLGEIDRPIILSAFDSSNRAVNYFPVRDDTEECRRWSFDNEKDTIEAFLKIREDEFKKFLDYFEQGFKDRTDDLHSFLINLYNNFPVNPNLFLDGIIRRFLPEFVRKGHLIRYAFVNLLHKKSKELDYNYFPWVDVRFFYNVPPDRHHGMGAIADQESARAEKHGEWFGKNHGPADEVIAKIKQERAEGLHLEQFFFEYLQPLFMGYEKNGEIFSGGDDFFSLKDQDLTRFEYLLVIPFYDAWIDERPCGSLKGNLLIPFEDDSGYEKRREFIEKHFERCSIWSQTLNQLLFESRSHNVLRLPVQFGDDSLKDFLSKVAFVQDWEKVRIFSKSELGGKPEYCFKRESDELWKYKESWELCKPGEHCLGCLPAGLKDVTIGSIQRKPVVLSSSDTDGHLFLLDLKDLLDPKVLPSIESKEMEKLGDYFLCFELPKHTYLPRGSVTKENLKRLREYYIHQMIPVFDKVLLKNKVIKHSIKSAVAAIISRNHSHHIGSHVTPRTSLKKVEDRLGVLGSKDLSPNEKKDIAGVLKQRLDQYIQKKADFVSEISTEPLTTTKAMSFFNEIVVSFIRNTLLMDNIGANEGVNYKKGYGNHNRLRIHVHYEDREFEARFHGGKSCSCVPVKHVNYPYSGRCLCRSPSALDIEPEMSDVAVAVPGPLGEFAFYAFLENFIRNAAKHNHEAFRKSPERYLDIHIRLSELEEEVGVRHDFYKVEIWDDVTVPDKNLADRLARFIDDPVVDHYGQLKKRAWGIAEMKIVANLLGGSDEFSRMESSLRVKEGDRLVFEFRIMKPKEIAVISERHTDQDDHMKNGIWCFPCFDDFLTHQKQGASPATFNMVILDRGVIGDLSVHSHLFPNRILAHEAIKEPLPGSVKIADGFMESIQCLNPAGIISRAWNVWLKGLMQHSNDTKDLRIVAFFGQEDDDPPTRDWLQTAKELEGRRGGPKLSVVYQGDDDNKVFPAPSKEEKLLVFDRHFDGYPSLPRDGIAFHEAFDKNSLDFVPIFSAKPSDVLVCQMAESAYLKVLVMDERIAEVAYDEILKGERDKPEKLYGQKERIVVNKWGNVFIASHVKINNENSQPLHHGIGDKFPQVLVEITTGKSEGRRAKGLNVTWIHNETNQGAKKQKIKPHVLIIHQGVIENFLAEKIPKRQNEDLVDALEAFFEELREFVPFIVVDSGRGIPANLPSKIKFMPFSLIEDYLMKERISKFNFMRIIMSLIRRGNR